MVFFGEENDLVKQISLISKTKSSDLEIFYTLKTHSYFILNHRQLKLWSFFEWIILLVSV